MIHERDIFWVARKYIKQLTGGLKMWMWNGIKAGFFFGLAMGLYYGTTEGVYSGIVSFVILGGLFGLFVSLFTIFQTKKFIRMGPDICEGKEVIKGGPANHIVEMESVGGWLYLTSDELIFVSHNFNFQRHSITMQLKEISSVSTYNAWGILPKRLSIKLTEGVKQKFVVDGPIDWVTTINLVRRLNVA